jgi:predicted NAD/FAD-dependent oxidoreductase
MRVAIIGAGLAGLAAAQQLITLNPQLEVTLFEKSRGPGGRVATRRRDDFTFDHGAQIFKLPTAEVAQLVLNDLDRTTLHQIDRPVWTFSGDGTISEGDSSHNAEGQWVYSDGINRLGKLLAATLNIQREVRIAAIHHTGTTYRLQDAPGHTVAEADVVLCTPPAPQTAELLAASTLPTDLQQSLLNELAKARYRRCLAVTLAFDQFVFRPYYALLNSDRSHAIAWLGLEHLKVPGRCPPGQSLIVAQLAANASLAEWDTAPEQLATHVSSLVADLLAEDLGVPLWFDRQGWRYALPDSAADPTVLNTTNSGLFFAGDYTAGQGRVHLAISSGWQAAQAICDYLATNA